MGVVIDLRTRRITRPETGGRFVTCAHCGERHPIVRLADGTRRCPTAFADNGQWFCRNRGCRAAHLGLDARRN